VGHLTGCHPEMQPTAERHVLEIGGHLVGADVHLRDDPRPPVVFLHGVMASVAVARELFDDPEAESWIALSLPGHHPGRFPAGMPQDAIDEAMFSDLAEAALERLVGDRRVIAAGWSTGGFAALDLALRHPRRVAAVATLAGFASGRITGLIGWMQWLSLHRLGRPVLRAGLWLTGRVPLLHDAATRLLAGSVAAGIAAPRTVIARMRDDFARHEPEAIYSMLAALRGIDITDRLAAVTVPTWIAGGGRDPVIPVAETRRLAAAIPGAELRLYEHGGHLFFCEWPGFRADFARWLAHVRGGAAAAR
jgi:pimeloyl-ACP methyl ester carboxylesterase